MYDMRSDFDWFCENRDAIIRDHVGERVIIQNRRVIGYAGTDREAIDRMRPAEVGTYSVQRCVPDDGGADFYYTGRYALA